MAARRHPLSRVLRRGAPGIAPGRGAGDACAGTGRKDGLEALPRELGAEAPSQARSAVRQDRDAPVQASTEVRVWVLSWRWLPVTRRRRGGPADPSGYGFGAEAAPAAAAREICRFLWGAPAALTCARPPVLS